MNLLSRLFNLFKVQSSSRERATTRRVTSANPFVIESPRIGFLNLLGSAAAQFVKEDKDALAPMFANVQESQNETPTCDVLLIYADLEPDGRVTNSSHGLRQIIQESRATIAILASENQANHCANAARRGSYNPVNLVITLKRKGKFASFYTQLFQRMFQGKSMPMAWVELAPQIPGDAHENCPEGIFMAEVSHIIFK